ncbi:DNA ligase 1-like protein, partial [Elysia marginata]
MELTGYDQICKHRQRKKAGKRDSGGRVCFVREEISKGVEEVSWKFEEGMYLKLCKDFFGWEEDLFVLSVYMRPVNSTCADLDVDVSCYDHLVEQMAVVSDRGNVIVAGDLNARTGERQKCLIGNESEIKESDVFLLPDIVRNDCLFTPENLLHNDCSVLRSNVDKNVNDYGVKLLQLCEASDLIILNGRASGDKGVGAHTYHNSRGASTIDYVLCCRGALEYVTNFAVETCCEFSDHCPVNFQLKRGGNVEQEGRWGEGER